MYRIQRPAQFDPPGRPSYVTHGNIAAFVRELQAPGHGAPQPRQGFWEWIVEEGEQGAYRRIGVVRKYPDHRVEFVPDPAAA